jgi:hypothetical protein
MKPDEITRTVNADPVMEASIANTHWQRLGHLFGQNMDRKAYAWRHGIAAAYRASPAEIETSPYVQKLHRLEKSEKSEKGISYEEESKKIRENRTKLENLQPHEFEAARWTFKNGHPRCLRCGDEERTGGVCTDARARAVRDGLLKGRQDEVVPPRLRTKFRTERRAMEGEDPLEQQVTPAKGVSNMGIEARRAKGQFSPVFEDKSKHAARAKEIGRDIHEKLMRLKDGIKLQKTLMMGHGALGPPTSTTGWTAAGGVEATHPAYKTLAPYAAKLSFKQLKAREAAN